MKNSFKETSIVYISISIFISILFINNAYAAAEQYYDQLYDETSRHIIYLNENWQEAGFYDYHVMDDNEDCPIIIKISNTPYKKCKDYMFQQINSKTTNCNVDYIVGRSFRLKCGANSGVENLGIQNLAVSGISKITDTDGQNWNPGKKEVITSCTNCGKKNSKPKASNSKSSSKGYCKTTESKSSFDPLKPLLHNPIVKPNCNGDNVEWEQSLFNEYCAYNSTNCIPKVGVECPQTPKNLPSCQWENHYYHQTSKQKKNQKKNQCSVPCSIGNRGNAQVLFNIGTGCDVSIQAFAPENYTCVNNTAIPSRNAISVTAGYTGIFAPVLNISDPDAMDENGHGTFIGSVAVGQGESVAHEGDIWCVKAFGLAGDDNTAWNKPRNDKAYTTALIQALDSVISLAESLISRGFATASSSQLILLPWNAPKNYLIDKLVRKAHNELYMTIIMAAGNDGTDASKFSPASAKCGTVVGGTDQCGKLLNKKIKNYKGSNFGHAVDFNVPGFLIGGQSILKDANGNPVKAQDIMKQETIDKNAAILSGNCSEVEVITNEYLKNYYEPSLQLRTGTGYAAAQVAGIFMAYTSKCHFVPREEYYKVDPKINCRCDPGIQNPLEFVSFADNTKTAAVGQSCFVSQKASMDVLLGRATTTEECLQSYVGRANTNQAGSLDIFLIALLLNPGRG